MKGADSLNYGWSGTILNVDLSRRKIVKEPLKKELALNYLGGRGMNSKILFDRVKSKINPFGPKNFLIFGVGPANGTLAPGSNRFTVTAISPQSGTLGDANSGGFFGAFLKFAGYDAIAITGRAKKPVYLWIDDSVVEIREAKHLWGKTTWETDEIIKEEVGNPEVGLACIGPAGENLVNYACVIAERSRAAGRCGIGAVMGSKKLKAIAVSGTGGVKIAHPDLLMKVVRENYEVLLMDESYYKAFSVEGSPSLIEMYNLMGALPTRNFQTGVFEKAEDLSGKRFVKNYVVQSKACFGCFLHCSHWYEIREGKYAGAKGEGLEYEAICGFGSRCGNSDLASTIVANELCNKYGLDAISTSGSIAFALECFERGLITTDDTGGVKLEWGNPDQIIDLVTKIANREGFGDFLAYGVKIMAEKIGDEAKKFAPHVKGVEIINADPRGPKAWALGYAVATRGADHLRAFPIGEFHFSADIAEEMFGTRDAVDLRKFKGKGKMVAWHENIRAVMDSLEICVYNAARTTVSREILEKGFFFPKALAKLIFAITGIKFDEADVLRTGERIVNLERVLNVKSGYSRKDDTLPLRFLKEPMPSGPLEGETVNLDPMLNEYYKARGWNVKTGIPTRKKLEKLGLKEAAKELHAQNSKSH